MATTSALWRRSIWLSLWIVGAGCTPVSDATGIDATMDDAADGGFGIRPLPVEDASSPIDASEFSQPDTSGLPYAREVISFAPGPHAGHGQDRFPDIVLGPPTGTGTLSGSLDVLSLGVGGEIVLGFGALCIADGPGPDFIVFENPFWPSGDRTRVFAEPGEVAVSEDGETWHAFDCDAQGDGEGRYAGCAGWTPSLSYDPFEVLPLDSEQTGGDAFDLGELGLARACFVRIRDLSSAGEGDNAGFDLDAVGLVHHIDGDPDAGL